MKIVITILIFLNLNFPLPSSAGHSISHATTLEFTVDPVLPKYIQDSIYQCFVTCLITANDDPLQRMQSKLTTIHKTNPSHIVTYWRAYTQYYLAIFLSQQNEKDAAEQAIDTGITWLDNNESKNAEDHALLALMKGFSIQFKGMRSVFISSEIKSHIKKAISLDPENIRVLFVAGNNDFYTPKLFGGGKNTESYLRKAIHASDQKLPNPYLPSWGKKKAYELLVKYYAKEKDWPKAKSALQDALSLFPEDYTLQKLASKMLDK